MEAAVDIIEQSSNTKHTNNNDRTPFLQLLAEYDFPQPQRGDILQGEILRVEPDVLYVDVGSKRDALVPHDEVSQLDETFLQSLSQGDEVPVYVTRTPVGDAPLLVSLERGLQQLDWERAEKLQANDETAECEIVNHNKGGLVAQFGRIQGFVPNSHIPELHSIHSHHERQRYKVSQIGETRPLKIIELTPRQERLVLSATAVQKEQRRAYLQTLTPGQIVTGKVVRLKSYGAFVDIGNEMTGLLHISKIAWQHLGHPAEVLTIGEELELMVDSVDVERQRLSLNRRELLPGPWQQFAAQYQVADLVEGEVMTLVDFGAFVRLPLDIEGLLHHSEMNIPAGSTVADILQPGDHILVRIINLEPDEQRLGLSMRRVSAAEEMTWLATREEYGNE